MPVEPANASNVEAPDPEGNEKARETAAAKVQPK
jgi:hypothetical protein